MADGAAAAQAEKPACWRACRRSHKRTLPLPLSKVWARQRQTLSAAVSRFADLESSPLWPHRHPEIAGMSSPCRLMYSLCSTSISWIAWLKYPARAPSRRAGPVRRKSMGKSVGYWRSHQVPMGDMDKPEHIKILEKC